MVEKINPMTYRKKFACPVCSEYTLFITNRFYIRKHYAECSNSCEVLDEEVSDILEKNQFNGFFKTSDIESGFYYFEILNELKPKIIDTRLDRFSNKQKEKIDNMAQIDFGYNNQLDDLVIEYMEANKLDDIDKSPSSFSYIMSLVEEIGSIRSQIVKNLFMIKFVEENNNRPFTFRFFMCNNFDYLVQIDDKMIVLLGIFSEYHFDEELINNKSNRILKHIKRNKDSCNELYLAFQEYHSDGFFNSKRKVRNSNTHGQSELNQWIKGNPQKASELDYNSLLIDQEMYRNDISKIITLLTKVQKFEEHLLTFIMTILKNIPEMKKTPMQEEQEEKFFDFPKTDKVYNSEKVEKKKEKIFYEISKKNNPILTDVFFRIDEVSRLITTIYFLEDQFFRKFPNEQINDLIDEEELLYSTVNRLFSCYDKMANYISKNFITEGEVKYFEDFNNSSIVSKNINQLVKNIIVDPNYKYINKVRNHGVHNVRWGKIYLQSETNTFYNPLFNSVTHCFDLLVQLIDETIC